MKHTKATKPGEPCIDVPFTEKEIEEAKKADEEHRRQLAIKRYKHERAMAYEARFGSLADELDFIYHNGLTKWKQEIKIIKERYPKPDGLT